MSGTEIEVEVETLIMCSVAAHAFPYTRSIYMSVKRDDVSFSLRSLSVTTAVQAPTARSGFPATASKGRCGSWMIILGFGRGGARRIGFRAIGG